MNYRVLLSLTIVPIVEILDDSGWPLAGVRTMLVNFVDPHKIGIV